MIKWVRKIQGEVLKRIRGRVIFFIKRKTESQIFTLKPFMEFELNSLCSQVYEKKRDQRELIKVGQRNFRKYMAMREWGW